MGLGAFGVFQPFAARTDRQDPVAAHLGAFVQRLERLVVERVFCPFVTRRPDHRFMRVGQALAAKVRHRIGLAPHHIVQDPEPGILQRRANAKDVVIRSDDPQRAVGLQDAPRLRQPVTGKPVIRRKGVELVPVVVDGVHTAVVRPVQRAFELQVVGRIGKDQVDTSGRKRGHCLDAIALDNRIQRERLGPRRRVNYGHSLPLSRRDPVAVRGAVLLRSATVPGSALPWRVIAL